MHENALPVIITHGWPGSIIEQLKVIEPLTKPTAHGGAEEDAFHVVIPSLPGYGFSAKPTAAAQWNPERIARAWATLMKRLGYERFVAQGGDWGNAVSETMALQEPEGLLAGRLRRRSPRILHVVQKSPQDAGLFSFLKLGIYLLGAAPQSF